MASSHSNCAMKPGTKLNEFEMQLLIDELFACQVPYHGPNGRKTFISVEMDDLIKRFE